ncbi:RRP12-like protein isoform X1 [Papaver somniferum]|uniref:RRP12-like protein isoform X1 n=1 Tax=Papaver somniferum TaxID=3469 RepID=UPI000E6FAB14|nr:RRP12-like protein isoform X1 [Papaver somniferum]XP_026405283.1 RRP12-like protein isoform X1 [Papaver somniferum]XP_026405284.1 RRP12-like protein isoform X1 [Papaver somniferum]
MKVRESRALKLVCDATKIMLLTNSDGALDKNILSVISHMFLKLGQLSYLYLKDVVHELAKLPRIANGDLTGTKCVYLEECFGSAVIAMGAEKILTLLPVVSFEKEELTSLNIWILPILRKYVVGSSLGYYMEHIIPLLQPLQQACKTAAELQAATRAFWDLLPAFCYYPTDTHIKFDSLAKKLLLLMEEDSMHENVCLALQQLVNQNKSIVESTQGIEDSFKHSTTCAINESTTGSQTVPSHYTVKVAKRNIKALASCSVVLLQALTDVFPNSPLEKRKYLKETIGCLASITDIIEVKKFSISLLAGELENQGGNRKVDEQGAQRCVIMEFASALGLGASEDLVYIILDCITPALLDDETYSKFFEEHTCFYSSRFVEMMSHLLGLKLSDVIMGLRRRFACLHTLVVYLLKSDSEMICAKSFIILKEIILALKDSEKGARKAAYNVLLEISCSLKSFSSPNLESPHMKLLNMISLHLSGAITTSTISGAVAALSLLIYNESDICASAPEVVPSVLSLLKSKAKEVIKAVLGFLEVLVFSLLASDLQNLLPHIV